MAAVGGVANGGTNSTDVSGSDQLASISQTEFLNLLVAQLQNQNPLDPMSNTDVATQLASLSEVGSLDSMNTSIGDLVSVQQLSSGEALIGAPVTYTNSGSASPVQGDVSGLTVQSDGTVNLTINGTSVPHQPH